MREGFGGFFKGGVGKNRIFLGIKWEGSVMKGVVIKRWRERARV